MLAPVRAFWQKRHMSQRDLSGWVILSSGGSRYIGRAVPFSPEEGGAITLSPAFEYVAAWQVGPQGVARPRHVLPLEMFPEADTIECAVYENMIHVDNLGPEVTRFLNHLIDAAETMRAQLRAQASGITIAKEVPKPISLVRQ